MNKKIQIIATLGPATSTKETVTALVDAGADIMRLNFSWGNYENMQSLIDTVREVEKEKGIVIPILQDLSGPRMVLPEGHTLDVTKMEVITEKDGKDLIFGLDNSVRYVALSFVSTSSDVHMLREMMVAHDMVTPIIAKIERKEALDDIEAIVDAADGVMIARGDLGIAYPIEQLPSIEKRIVELCNEKGKFVIVATQMMLSMTESTTPTRAEVMDVATAVALGADACMLSEETSTGKHPVETVAAMRKIVTFAEEEKESPHTFKKSAPVPTSTIAPTSAPETMTKKIYITRPIHESGRALLREKGYEITVGEAGDVPTHESIIAALQSVPYDAVVTFLTDTVDATLFDAVPTAKLFANYSVGFNNVHLEDAEARGVAITNTPGCAGLAVAEHTVALTLALTARVAEGDEYMRAGKFAGWQPDLLIGTDLSGKTVGFVGVGDIGARAAKILSKGFGCRIIYNDVNKNESLEKEDAARFVERDELFRTADIVSIHVPLLPTTKHLVNADVLKSMKPTALLINTARGPIIDEVALVEALKQKTIAGAGLDVYEFEPKVVEGLIDLPNVVLTPHIASARESVRVKMAETVAKNIISFFETGAPLTPVKK